MNLPKQSFAITSMLFCATVASAAVFDESTLGDFSSSAGTPTPLAFEIGQNQIIGSVSAGSGDTRDYITFTVPVGAQFTALLVNEYEDPSIMGSLDGDRGFHAINIGSTSFVPGGGTIGNFLGGDHFEPPAVAGTDYLPDLAAATLGGTGFTAPLGAGTYTYLIQQTGSEISNYDLTFTVVPEPSTYAAIIGGIALAFVGIRRFRR